MIEFEGVAKMYEGHREALSDVNFRLAPGEMAFLTGQSGAGKSTLLRLILGWKIFIRYRTGGGFRFINFVW